MFSLFGISLVIYLGYIIHAHASFVHEIHKTNKAVLHFSENC